MNHSASSVLRTGLWLLLAATLAGCPKARVEQQCRFNDECEGQLICAGSFCREQCRSDRDCPEIGFCVPSTDPSKSVCVLRRSPRLCSMDSECGAGRICTHEGLCSPECRSDRDCRTFNLRGACTPGRFCVLPPEPDAGLRCGGGSVECAGRCVDLQTDSAHCGVCAATCTASQICAMGSCEDRCFGGAVLCGAQCVAVATDPSNCGQCGRVCSSNNADRSWCHDGLCKALCTSGFADCDGDPASPCETDTRTSEQHCGRCSNACPAARVCGGGRCLLPMSMAHYAFEGDGIDAVASLDLRVVGATFVQGVSGRAISFNGTASEYAIRTADDAVFDLMSGDFTLSLWFWVDATAGAQTLVEKLGGASGPGWSLSVATSTSLELTVEAVIITAPVSVRAGRWHHVAVRREGRLYSVFFDGGLAANSAAATVLNGTTAPLVLGRRNVGGAPSNFLRGRLDEFSLSGRALTDAEIRTEYTSLAP